MATRLLGTGLVLGLVISASAYDGVLNFQVMTPPVSLFETSHQAIVDAWHYALSLPAEKMDTYGAIMRPMMRHLLEVHSAIKCYAQEDQERMVPEDTIFLYDLLQRVIGCLEQKQLPILYGAVVVCQECQQVLEPLIHNDK